MKFLKYKMPGNGKTGQDNAEGYQQQQQQQVFWRPVAGNKRMKTFSFM